MDVDQCKANGVGGFPKMVAACLHQRLVLPINVRLALGLGPHSE